MIQKDLSNTLLSFCVPLNPHLFLVSIFIYIKTNPTLILKIIQAIPGQSLVTQAEVEKFLGSKLNLQLATIDKQGYPNIQPVWFYYNKDSAKLYSGTQKMTKKVQNICRNPDKIYFSIDEKNFPYRGVKGRGLASISENIDKNITIIEKKDKSKVLWHA
jgi:general stress protein 26